MTTALFFLALTAGADVSPRTPACAFLERVRCAVEAVRNDREGTMEDRVRRAFGSLEPEYVRYASTYEVGDRMESNDQEEFEHCKGLGRLGGKRDMVTKEVDEALRRQGIVFVEWSGRPAPVGRCLVFTVSDHPKTSSYVMIRLAAESVPRRRS